MNWLTAPQYSPYVVGVGIGVLSWLAFLLSDKAIGCSTAFARTSGMILRLVRGRKVLDMAYFKKFAPVIDWEWMLVLGIVIGAFAAAKLGGTFKIDWVPPLWAGAAGETPVLRWAVALLGGIFMGLGARWAGGCTSGHGISGCLQLAVSGWIAAVCFFVGGIASAMLIFKVILGGGA